MMKKLFILLILVISITIILVISITSCDNNQKKINAEIMEILKADADNYLQSSYNIAIKTGVKHARNTLELVDACFSHQLGSVLSFEDSISLLDYANIKMLDEAQLFTISGCVPFTSDEEKIGALFPIMRSAISSGNMVFFQFFFNKYYREYVPKGESFYLLEIAITYCSTDFITYLINEYYPFNSILWGGKEKFKRFYSLACDFDIPTSKKLDEYWEQSEEG